MNNIPMNSSAMQHFQNQRLMTIASMQQHLGLPNSQIGSSNNLFMMNNQSDDHIQAMINSSMRRSNEASNIEYNMSYSNMDKYTSESIALMNPMTNMHGINDERKRKMQQNNEKVDLVDSDSDSEEDVPLKRRNKNINNGR
jgi:hypothetical protein